MAIDSIDSTAVSRFNKAYNRTMGEEGMYSNDPLDPGGETFLGISRYWHPSWKGWEIIDTYGAKLVPPPAMKELHALARSFYKETFWDRLQGDKLAEISPAIAEKVFDTAVNLSVTDSIRWLQDSLNLLNNNTILYQDILVDGRIGKITMSTLERYLSTRPGSREQNQRRLLNVFGILQGGHYVNEMRKYPEKERFRGWFDRAVA